MKYITLFSLCIVLISCTTTSSTTLVDQKIDVKDSKGAINFLVNNKTILSYVYRATQAPEGIDSSYTRSGYIHPMATLDGDTLTRIQPADHYHHYGIWNPWTHVLYNGDTLDFWNLAKKQATVRHAEILSLDDETDSAILTVKHEHVVLNDNKVEVVLNEIQQISLHGVDSSSYMIDLQFDYTCATDRPFQILKYRYGGLGWRATSKWNQHNSEIITNIKSSRNEIDGSKGKWCMARGELDERYGGAIIMSHPDNYEFPEPLRVWPDSAMTTGDIFINVAPTKFTDWELLPGNTYTLKYRILVFNHQMTAIEASKAWKAYAE